MDKRFQNHKRKGRRKRKFGPNKLDYHHFLFQGKHWRQSSAHRLREHPYCGAYIPQQTLHRAIHAKVHDVPVPNARECKLALESINYGLRTGELRINDSPTTKLKVLIMLFADTCPATVAILKWQYEIINKFYNKKTPH